MQNKGRNDGWCSAGFVPVNGSWDFAPVRESCPQRRATAAEQSACTAETAPRCTCTDAAQTASAASSSHPFPAMVAVEMQPLADLYAPESALIAGTLFADLHKPMAGYAPCAASSCDRQQANAFAAWELRLYLRTHPDDAEALRLMRQMCGTQSYATAFYTPGSANSPWPWEYEANSAC